MSVLTGARALAHYFDQTAVINATQKFVKSYGLYGFTGGVFAYDMLRAKPGERKDKLIRDVLVLGPSLMATKWGINHIAEPAAHLPAMKTMQPKLFQEIKSIVGNKLAPLLERSLKAPVEAFEVNNPAYLLGKGHRQLTQARDFYKFGEIYKLIDSVKRSNHANKSQLLEAMFPLPGEEHEVSVLSHMITPLFKGKLPKIPSMSLVAEDHMLKFFTAGAGIVGAGMAGGFAHNAVKGVKEKTAYVNMVKEGIFQFIANIALCAVGASIGVTASDVSGITAWSEKSRLGRGVRMGTILAGLSIGILGGGKAANWMANRYINPIFEWLDERKKGTSFKTIQNKWTQLPPDRKVEFLDGVLHLDDLPTAAALAGVEIVKPFIPLFFEVSAIRSGFGYRTKGINQGLHTSATQLDRPAMTSSVSLPKANEATVEGAGVDLSKPQVSAFADIPARVSPTTTGANGPLRRTSGLALTMIQPAVQPAPAAMNPKTYGSPPVLLTASVTQTYSPYPHTDAWHPVVSKAPLYYQGQPMMVSRPNPFWQTQRLL